MYETADFKKGLKLMVDGSPYVVVDFQHVKPGKGNQFSRTKLRPPDPLRVVDARVPREEIARDARKTRVEPGLSSEELERHQRRRQRRVRRPRENRDEAHAGK